MTEDNVPCSIDGVVFFKVNDPEKAIKVEKFNFAITQLAQAALRDVCGKVELDTILSKREKWEKTLKPLLRKKQKFGV
jgi:regulator of protease activity HflC (stomatin/prohibitin superfamily)